MMQSLNKASFFQFALLLILFHFPAKWIASQAPIPAKYDGFLYRDNQEELHLSDSVMVEAFFDPLCPDSRDAWPPLKKVLKYYSGRVSLIVHPFPLPYHDNAFVACRALHIANKLNASTTFPLMELFYKYQGKFYNRPTYHMSRASIVSHMVNLMAKALGNSSIASIESGFEDRETDLATRTSFKYGCSRGVYGTPFFFVNGFLLPDGGSAIDYNNWRSILDPLLAQNQQERSDEDPLYDFL